MRSATTFTGSVTFHKYLHFRKLSIMPIENMYICQVPGGQKNLKKTLSYHSDYLAVIVRLLLNSLYALWLWHRRKRFVVVMYFKMEPQRDNQWKCLPFFVRDTMWVKALTLSVSHNRLRNQEAHERWRRCQQTCR